VARGTGGGDQTNEEPPDGNHNAPRHRPRGRGFLEDLGDHEMTSWWARAASTGPTGPEGRQLTLGGVE